MIPIRKQHSLAVKFTSVRLKVKSAVLRTMEGRSPVVGNKPHYTTRHTFLHNRTLQPMREYVYNRLRVVYFLILCGRRRVTSSTQVLKRKQEENARYSSLHCYEIRFTGIEYLGLKSMSSFIVCLFTLVLNVCFLHKFKQSE